MNRDKVRRGVLRVFQDVDDATLRFQEKTGLQCPEGCGACCENAQVEATAAEMLPLAMDLASRGAAPEALQRAAAGHGAWCVFYEQRAPGEGRCGVYDFRPTICRLYGFAGVRKKHGGLELTACWRHRETQGGTVDVAEHAVEEGRWELPVFADVQRRIQQRGGVWGRMRTPINDALKTALEVVLAP